MFTRQRALRVGSRISQILTGTTIAAAAATVITVGWINTVQHDQVLIVTSGSMSPTFNVGDAVISAPVNVSTLHAGDVVTFGATPMRAPTTHRVLEIVTHRDGLYFQTKGDANKVEDEALVPAATVSGVMTGSIPFFGRWLAFYQGPGKVLLLGTPLVLIVIGQVRALWAGRRRDDTATTLTTAVT